MPTQLALDQYRDTWRVRATGRLAVRVPALRLQRSERRAPFTGNASTAGYSGRPPLGLTVGGSFSQRRFDSELFRGRWRLGDFNELLRSAEPGLLSLRCRSPASGVEFSLEFRPSNGHALTLRTNYNLFRDIEGPTGRIRPDARNLENQTPTAGASARAARRASPAITTRSTRSTRL